MESISEVNYLRDRKNPLHTNRCISWIYYHITTNVYFGGSNFEDYEYFGKVMFNLVYDCNV